MGIVLSLNDYVSTIQDTSKTHFGDDFIIDTSISVYNFDSIKLGILPQIGLNNECKSCDALFIAEDRNILIEFKKTTYEKLFKIENGRQYPDKGRPESNCLKIKLLDSKNLLSILRQYNILQHEKDEVFIVFEKGKPMEGRVLEPDKVEVHPFSISSRFKRLTTLDNTKEPILFGLEKMKDTLYVDVHTYTKEQFIRKFIVLHNKRLNA